MTYSQAGAAIATAVALMITTAGCDQASEVEEGTVKCQGLNECAGLSECAGADGENDCQGQNECAGQGWISVDSEDGCEEQGGTVID